MKNNKGFSLVELIVVIAIMAILVGVAVPVYTNYISKAREAKDAQYLDELCRATQFFAVENNIELGSIWVAPVITDSQGILLYDTENNLYQGDLSALYAMIGGYDFELLETSEFVYFTPGTVDDTTDVKCSHTDGTTPTPSTCIQQGYVTCNECGKVIQLLPLGDHTIYVEIIGNLHVSRCSVCNYVKVEPQGNKIG